MKLSCLFFHFELIGKELEHKDTTQGCAFVKKMARLHGFVAYWENYWTQAVNFWSVYLIFSSFLLIKSITLPSTTVHSFNLCTNMLSNCRIIKNNSFSSILSVILQGIGIRFVYDTHTETHAHTYIHTHVKTSLLIF